MRGSIFKKQCVSVAILEKNFTRRKKERREGGKETADRPHHVDTVVSLSVLLCYDWEEAIAPRQ